MFEVQIYRDNFFDWRWYLYEVDGDGKRLSREDSGYTLTKFGAVFAARLSARNIRKKRQWRNKNYTKRI